MRLLLIIFLASISTPFLFGQLNGVYTIGGASPDYVTFTNAVTALTTNGISGPVTFNVRSGIYSEQLIIPEIAGSSPSAIITFQSESGVNSDVVLEHAHGASANNFLIATIAFSGADNFVFQNMTIRAVPPLPTANGNNRTIFIADDANNIGFINNRIESWMPTNVIDPTRDCIYLGLGGGAGQTASNDSISFINNVIVGGRCGIEQRGYNSWPGAHQSTGFHIVGNEFVNQVAHCVRMNTMRRVFIESNQMTDTNNMTNFIAIELEWIEDSLSIAKNNIYLPSGGIGVDIRDIDIGANNYRKILNNMISIGPGNNSNNAYGILTQLCDTLTIAFNSIQVSSTVNNNSCIRGYSHMYNYNNQYVNTGGDNTMESAPFSYFVESNYNNLYSTGPSLSNMGATLVDMYTNYGMEASSINVNPIFLTPDNLIPQNPMAFDQGVPYANVTDDIYGTIRSLTTPDMGAYEGDIIDDDAGVTFSNIALITACPGDVVPIYVKFTNYGGNVISSVDIDLQGNITSWTGTLNPLEQSDSIFVGNITVPASPYQVYSIWTENPNGTTDNSTANDTLYNTIYPGLIGSYSVGGGGSDFSSLNDVAQTINNSFLCGPVVINLEPGTYTEQVTFNAVNGSSPINTVTFQSVGLDSSTVIIEADPGSSNTDYIIRLNQADYFTFQHLTVTALNSSYGRAFYLLGADNSTIRNCVIEGEAPPGQATLLLDYYTSVPTPADSLVVSNNRFIQGGQQIVALASDRMVITNNIFEGTASGTMDLTAQQNAVIRNNVITGSRTNPCIDLSLMGENIDISNNQIDVSGTNVISCVGVSATSANPLTIQNNFISATGNAFHFNNCSYIDVLNNSINTLGSQANVRVVLGYTKYRFFNNIFKNPGSEYYNFQSTTIDVNEIDSDFNAFYSYGADYMVASGSNLDFTTWLGTYNLDASSVIADPQYISPTNLHIDNALDLDGAGTPLPEVTDDIDGETRNALNPDIGADEFNINWSTFRDIAFVGISQPDTAQCTLYDSLIIQVANYSNFPIDSFTVQWWMFDLLRDSSSYVINIPAQDTVDVYITEFNFNHNTHYFFDFILTYPNGLPDNNMGNNLGAFDYYYLDNCTIYQRSVSDCNDLVELYIKDFPRASIQWSTGGTTNSILVPSSPGTYSVIVTHENGCVVNDTIVIN